MIFINYCNFKIDIIKILYHDDLCVLLEIFHLIDYTTSTCSAVKRSESDDNMRFKSTLIYAKQKIYDM